MCAVYAVVARRTFISVALCSHLPQNVNDPDSSSTFFFPTVPKLVSQKKKGKMLFLFVCVPVIRAGGPLFTSSGATALIAHGLASAVSHSLSCGCGPRGRLQLTTGPLPRAPLSSWAHFQLKTQGALQAHCE